MLDFLDPLAANKPLTLLLCSIAFALVCIELSVALWRGKLQARGVISLAAKALVVVALAFGLGFAFSRLKMEAGFGRVMYFLVLILVAAFCVAGYIAGCRRQVRAATANALRKSASSTAVTRYAKGWMYGTCFALFVFAAMLLAFGRADFYMPMIPLAIAAVAILLAALLLPRIWFGLAAGAIAAFFVLSLWQSLATASAATLPLVAPALAATCLLTAACVSLTLRK